MEATGFRTMHVPRAYAVAGPAYGGAVLALYTHIAVGERARRADVAGAALRTVAVACSGPRAGARGGRVRAFTQRPDFEWVLLE